MSGGGDPDGTGPRGRAATRRASGSGVEWAVLALGVVGAVLVWAVWPSSGNYDTVLDLVWARELLDGQKPGFEAYAASTPHPLWVAFGVPVVAAFGDQGDRVMVLLSSLSLAVLAAAVARLGRTAGESVAVPGRARAAGRTTAAVAGLLLLSSFAFGLLAAKGYLDVPFLALVAWAGAWALRRPGRWRGPAFLLLLAGLLRPEAWVLAGLHWLWCTARGPWSAGGADVRRASPDAPAGTAASVAAADGSSSGASVDGGPGSEAGPAAPRLPGRGAHLALVLAAPVLWAAMDLWVTGNPLHSLTATSQLADDLGRDRGIAKAPRLLVSQLVDQSRPPVAVAGLAGLAVLLLAPRLGLRRAPRSVRVVLVALLAAGVLTFLAAGVGGLSLIPRYLSVPVVAITVLGALAATGWVGLPPRSSSAPAPGLPSVGTASGRDDGDGDTPGDVRASARDVRAGRTDGQEPAPAVDRPGGPAPRIAGLPVRTAWAAVVVAGAVLGVGAYLTVKRDSVTSIRDELAFLADARTDVRALVDDPAVRRDARCGPISLPTYRLVPEIRLQLDASSDAVLARSDPRARRVGATSRGVAIVVDEDALDGKWRQRYGQADGVPRTTKPAPPGFRPVARAGAFTAWARCG